MSARLWGNCPSCQLQPTFLEPYGDGVKDFVFCADQNECGWSEDVPVVPSVGEQLRAQRQDEAA